MGLELTVAPALDPISIAEARAQCRITDTDEDGLLAGYILAARHFVETYTRRALMTQTWRLTIDRAWPRVYERDLDRWFYRIVLPRPPSQSVSSIQYVDLAGATQTLPADQYTPPRKLDTGEWAIEPAYGVTWPSVRDQLAAITVTFLAGYGNNPGDIPEGLRQAMLLLIGHSFDNREAVNVGNIVNEMPLAVDALLFQHRVFY